MSRICVDRPTGQAASLDEPINQPGGGAKIQTISETRIESKSPGKGLEPNGDQRRVQAELIDQLYKQTPIGMIATLVNSAILVFIL